MGGHRIDTRSPAGKPMVTTLAAIAEFERGLLLERQRGGVADAKQDDGKYKGGSPRHVPSAPRGSSSKPKGLERAEIAGRLGIGVATVYRVLADAKKGADDPKAVA
jgi:DNA invertase Pin-like site-specific DNA recombinase